METNKKIDEVFTELKKEINSIFLSRPVKNFTEKNNIKLAAVAEYDYTMRDLTEKNKVSLFSSER